MLLVIINHLLLWFFFDDLILIFLSDGTFWHTQKCFLLSLGSDVAATLGRRCMTVDMTSGYRLRGDWEPVPNYEKKFVLKKRPC